MKKLLSLSVIIFVCALIMPTISLAADQWGLSSDANGGLSGGVQGNTMSASFGSDGSWSIGSGKDAGGAWGSGGGWRLSNLSNFGLPQGHISNIVSNILTWILMLFGTLGIIGFIVSGIMYILAAGNDDTIKTAKNAMKNSIIGVIVGLAGFVIIQAIAAILNVGSQI